MPTITATPAAAFDYSKLSTGEPQLVAAGASYKNNATGQMVPAGTDHYVTYTNDGDFAGTVMVAPGQKIRMIDRANNNSVVFEGTGPEGAKQAVALANAVSADKGRKAAWAIEADQTNNGDWKIQAYERYDPKKPNLIGGIFTYAFPKLADIVLPILGAMIGGPLGAAAGSAVSSVAQGRSLEATALRAGLAGATSFGADKLTPLITGALANVAGPAAANTLSNVVGPAATNTLTKVGTDAAVKAAVNAAAPVVAGSVSEIVVTMAAKSVVAQLITQGASQAVINAAVDQIAQNIKAGRPPTEGVETSPPPGADTFSSSSGTPSLAGGTGPNTIEEIVVTATKDAANKVSFADLVLKYGEDIAKVAFNAAASAILPSDKPPTTEPPLKPGEVRLQELALERTATEGAARGLNVDQLVALGIPAAMAFAAVRGVTGAEALQSVNPVSTTNVAANPPPGNVTGLTPTNVVGPPQSLLAAITAGTLPAWIAANPLLAIQYGLVAAGAVSSLVGGGGGGGSGSGGLTVGTSGAPGTRGSLGARFSAQLGAPRGLFSVLGSTPTLPNSRPSNNFSVTPSGGTTLTTATTPATGGGTTSTTATTPATGGGTTSTTTPAGVPGAASLSAYLALYPDVAAAAAKDPNGYGDADGDGTITARDFALGHYLRYGVKEGRKMGAKAGGAVHGYAHGSSPRREFAVQGRGTGRSDSIPAVLSDGEYVMDAETVALLGDGSSKAGAAKLDQFRVRVRKHKGRDLARGKFSVNAKRPEAYLSGGAS